jgi:hypothetical protein
MRRSLPRALGIALSIGALAACTSSPADTIEPPTGSDAVTGGDIIVGGDLNDDVSRTADSTIAPPTPASSSTSEPIATTRATSVATTPPPVTRPPTTVRPSTTEAEVVGDGPVLTAPGNDGTSETPPAGGGLMPVFFAIEATPTIGCASSNPGTARLRWEVIGSEAVDIAIGSATSVFRLAQPPAGTLDVPLDCTTGSKYFVIASNDDGSTTRSVSLAADAPG